jgi:hypothetical protein
MTSPSDSGPARRGDVVDDRGIRAYSWEWGDVPGQRRGLPWLGIFLVVFGALLLLRQFLPAYATAGSLITIALGIAFLIKWAVDRSTLALYAGVIVTSLGVPDLLEAAGVAGGPGLGTLCLGIAFLILAAFRASHGGGAGWQAYLGLILAVVGGSQVAVPAISGLVLPALLVIGGLYLLLRGSRQIT